METKQTTQNPINHSPAIKFRPFTNSKQDFEAIVQFGTDQRVNRTLQFDPFTSQNDALRFIETFVRPHPYFRFICLSAAAAGDPPVGSIALRPEDCGGGRRRVSLGYSVVPEFWGMGIATAAVRMAVEAAFEEWVEVERVQAVVFVDNLASRRVLEKAGFSEEAVLRKYFVSKGEVRDLVMYSFVAGDCR